MTKPLQHPEFIIIDDVVSNTTFGQKERMKKLSEILEKMKKNHPDCISESISIEFKEEDLLSVGKDKKCPKKPQKP